MRGIDHPEVADLAAVSAAVARLRDSTGSAGPHLRCVQAAAKYLANVLQNPTMGKVGPAATDAFPGKNRPRGVPVDRTCLSLRLNRCSLALATSVVATHQYRVINTSNAVFLRDVVSVQGGVELMVALGFREDADGQLVLPMVREAGKQRERGGGATQIEMKRGTKAER